MRANGNVNKSSKQWKKMLEHSFFCKWTIGEPNSRAFVELQNAK